MSDRAYIGALVRAMAARCELEDPGTFAAKREDARVRSVAEGEAMYGIGNVVSTPNGRTGRTTRMLLRALVAMDAGCTVVIEAASLPDADQIMSRLMQLARSAGFGRGVLASETRRGLHVAWPGPCPTRRTCPNPDVRLFDHACACGFVSPHLVGTHAPCQLGRHHESPHCMEPLPSDDRDAVREAATRLASLIESDEVLAANDHAGLLEAASRTIMNLQVRSESRAQGHLRVLAQTFGCAPDAEEIVDAAIAHGWKRSEDPK